MALGYALNRMNFSETQKTSENVQLKYTASAINRLVFTASIF